MRNHSKSGKEEEASSEPSIAPRWWATQEKASCNLDILVPLSPEISRRRLAIYYLVTFIYRYRRAGHSVKGLIITPHTHGEGPRATIRQNPNRGFLRSVGSCSQARFLLIEHPTGRIRGHDEPSNSHPGQRSASRNSGRPPHRDHQQEEGEKLDGDFLR